MDLRDVNYLGPLGFTLSLEERSGLEISIIQRKNDENIEKIMFWGKIQGEENDYLIAYGLMESYGFPKKKFYFSTGPSYTLQQMPDVPPQHLEKAKLVTTRFLGDPGAVLDDDNGSLADADAFREVHRLSYTVNAIDEATAVVPRGAFLVDPAHKIIENKGFEGLPHAAASSLRSYFHFRPATLKDRVSALEKDGLVRATDFLDPVDVDLPKGVWSLQPNEANTVMTLRSLLWPGAFFFHEVATRVYGCAYFGTGQFNRDVAFML